MSDVLTTYESLGAAYGKRTLRLLRSDHSRIYLALFRAIFPDGSQGILAEDLWSRMDECLADLAAAGHADELPIEDGQIKSGRAVCRELTDRYGWVESEMVGDGRLEYHLTSDAIEALEIVERLGSADTLVSGSRMRTLLEAIDMATVLFSPDYEEGLAVLRRRLEQAQAQLDAYEAAGGGEPLSLERARDEVVNIVSLMSGLPADLRRLGEGVHAQANGLIDSFREDVRPVGAIVGDYIDDARMLLDGTDQGRSFKDAVSVLGNQAVTDEVNAKLDVIANAPVFAESSYEQSRRLQDGWDQIGTGIEWVNAEDLRASRAVLWAVSRHDVTRDRELTGTLKELETAVYRWAGVVGARDEGPVVPTMGVWDVESLRSRPFVEGVPAPPPALAQGEADVAVLDLEELRRLGGPLTGELLDAIAAQMPLSAPKVDLGSAFNALPAAMRRPVELAGLVQLAATLGVDMGRSERVRYECVDLDGNDVVWEGPRIVVTAAQFDEGRDETHGEGSALL